MPKDYTVQLVEGEREWEGSYGPMRSYDLTVSDGVVDTAVEVSQKPMTPAPKAGDVIHGDIQPATNPQFRPKLKKAQMGGFGGGGGRPEDPDRQKRIERQHSQEMALRYVSVKGKVDFTFEDVVKLADAFDRDIAAAAQKGKPAPPPKPPPPPPEVPPDTSGLGETAPADDSIPF